MKKLLLALPLLLCTALSALAQNAITLPIAANAIADLGNGPIKVRMIAGNASIFTSLGSGVGSTSGSSTALTLTTTPATPPIVGGLISGSGVASGTTVAAYNGTTGITLSAAMTVPSSTTVSWGSACPSSPPSNVIQASAMADYYIMYTQARVCAVSPGGPVNTLLIEPIFYDSALPVAGVANDFPIYNSDGTGFADSGMYLLPAVSGGNLYASTTGSDGNNTCTNSGFPCTLKGACLERTFLATNLVGAITINVADGTYSAVDSRNAVCSVIGDGGGSPTTLTNIIGDCSNRANTIIAVPNGDTGFFLKDYGNAFIHCFSITGGTSATGVSGSQYAIADVANITWGIFGSGSVHYNFSLSSTLNEDGAETISGNFNQRIDLSSGASLAVAPGAVTTCTVTPTFSFWLVAIGNTNINVTNQSFSGCGSVVTGSQAFLEGPGFMATGTVPCTSFFPGSPNSCTIKLGFMDDAGDNQTSPQAVGGVSCPSGITAGTVTVVNGVITHC